MIPVAWIPTPRPPDRPMESRISDDPATPLGDDD
jgi:hypothetical protein